MEVKIKGKIPCPIKKFGKVRRPEAGKGQGKQGNKIIPGFIKEY